MGHDKKEIIVLLVLMAVLLIAEGVSYALDSPHNNMVSPAIGCGNCHYSQGSSPPAWVSQVPANIDDTYYNRMCRSCHDGSGTHDGVPDPTRVTHSNGTTASTRWGSMWTTECRTCHTPHQQGQYYWKSQAFLLSPSRIISLIGAYDAGNNRTQITLTTALPSGVNYQNYYFMPNISVPLFYKILDNTDGAISFYVRGQVNTKYATAGNSANVVYGKLTRPYISFRNPGGVLKSGYVKLYNSTGSYTLGDSAQAATSVCYICHTLTKYWNTAWGNTAHYSGQGCQGCHPHNQGFDQSGGCTGCHGDPPSNNGLGGDGLAITNGGTGSTTEGAHPDHAVTLDYACSTCHTNGMPATPVTDYKIQIGFDTFGVQTGAYRGRTGPLPNGYSYINGNAGTTITQDGSMTCSNMYCHSNVQANGGSGGPTSYGTPAWTNTSGTVICGNCHRADGTGDGTRMNSGSHTGHVNATTYNMGCPRCHTGAGSGSSVHVNRNVNVIINSTYGASASYTSGGTPGNGYGNCSNNKCHSTGTASPTYRVATWGATLASDCTGCHGNNATSASPVATGTHTSHINNSGTIGTNFKCARCHNATVSVGDDRVVTNYPNHANLIRNVVMSDGGTWTSATGECTSLYCHSDGNPLAGSRAYRSIIWAGAGIGCDGCHGTGNSKGSPDHGSAGSGVPGSNSHPKHAITSDIGCSECHYNTTQTDTFIVLGSARHINGTATTDIIFNTGGYSASGVYKAGQVCSNTYCHGTGDSAPWGGSVACGSCHAVKNTLLGAHNDHYEDTVNAVNRLAVNNSLVGTYRFNCGVCHDNTPHATGPANTNRTAQVIFNATIAGSGTFTQGGTSYPDGGFEYTNSTCTSTYCHSNGIGGAPRIDYTGYNWNSGEGTLPCSGCHYFNAGSGFPMATGKHTAHINDGTVMSNKTCDTCHVATAGTGTSITNKVLHVNQAKNVNINGTYDSDSNSYNNYASPNCTNVYCHSDGKSSPTYDSVSWSGAAADCVYCHGGANGSTGGVDTALTVSHTAHTNPTYAYGCTDCHNDVAQSNNAIKAANVGWHVNKVANVTINSTAYGSGTYGTEAGVCSNTYCHGTRSGTVAVWGAATLDTYNACTLCHGADTVGADGLTNSAAPGAGGTGTDTAGAFVNTDAEVGAHRAHLEGTGNISAPFTCVECHRVPASVKAQYHIDNALPAEITYQGPIGIINAQGNPQYTFATGECSNTYCHDARNFKKAETTPSWANGTDYKPTWANASYLTGPPYDSTDCGMCHGWPPAGTHSSSINCNQCHTYLNADDLSFGDKTQHVDGIVQASGDCNTCHGYPPISGDGKDGFYAGDTQGDGGKGAHWSLDLEGAHITNANLNPTTDLYGIVSTGYKYCVPCHSGGTHFNNVLEVSIQVSNSFDGTTGSWMYKGERGNTAVAKTCSNVNCHYQETPRWSCPGEE